jgi:preprotein translocase subunit SecD
MLYFARWKIVVVVIACLAGLAFTAPNFFSKSSLQNSPTWLPRDQVRLGLDLQGGAHLLIEVLEDSVVDQRLNDLVETIRIELRDPEKERIGYRGGIRIRNKNVEFIVRKPEQVDEALSRVKSLATNVAPNMLTGQTGGRDIEVTLEEGDRIVVSLTEEALIDRIKSAVEQSVEIVRIRIEEFGVREPTIQRQGDNRILIQLPGITDDELTRIKKLIGETANMQFRLVNTRMSVEEALNSRVPADSTIVDQRDENGELIRQWLVHKKVMVKGDNLVDAQPTYDQGQPVVSFRFDAEGGKKFGDATAKNVGRPFAIILDDNVISAPVIRSAILGGSGIISGGFNPQTASDLALLLRAGALPADIRILEERTVGPGLGADSVAAGKIASVIAFIAVMIFMVLSYGIFGLAANIALIANLFLIVGALSLFQATLTLPGIAGIVLTMGMAVDANVLVFERIKEEVRSGKTPFAAMESGYKRAIGTILDANITTFIAATIMFAIGSGPIQGFAVTLSIGILTSVFTAVTVTRLILVLWVRRKRPTALPI